MKAPEMRQTKHIACHVNDLTLEAWDAVRKAESPDPDAPDKWSQWIREKVDMAINMDLLQSVTSMHRTSERRNYAERTKR